MMEEWVSVGGDLLIGGRFFGEGVSKVKEVPSVLPPMDGVTAPITCVPCSGGEKHSCLNSSRVNTETGCWLVAGAAAETLRAVEAVGAVGAGVNGVWS